MLCLGAEMTYVSHAYGSRGSNKFYIAILAGTAVHVRYGRRGHWSHSHGTKRFATVEEACAEMWRTVRGKTGKGYHVIDAAVFEVRDDEVEAAADFASRFNEPGATLMSHWQVFESNERAGERQEVLTYPDSSGRSPRTPKQGKVLLRSLVDPACPEEILLACALPAPSERFLSPMAMSHPNCTETARVAHFLNRSTAAFA